MADNIAFQLAPFLFFAIVPTIPTIKLLRKQGLSPAWSALNIIPLVGTLVIVYGLAFGMGRVVKWWLVLCAASALLTWLSGNRPH